MTECGKVQFNAGILQIFIVVSLLMGAMVLSCPENSVAPHRSLFFNWFRFNLLLFLFLIYSPFLFYYLSMNYIHFFLICHLIFFLFIQYNFCHLLCSDAWWYSYCFPLLFLLFLYVVYFGIVVITVTCFFSVVLEFKYTREGCSI